MEQAEIRIQRNSTIVPSLSVCKLIFLKTSNLLALSQWHQLVFFGNDKFDSQVEISLFSGLLNYNILTVYCMFQYRFKKQKSFSVIYSINTQEPWPYDILFDKNILTEHNLNDIYKNLMPFI